MSNGSLRTGLACLAWLAVAAVGVSAGSAMAAVGFDGLLDSGGTGLNPALQNPEVNGVAAYVVDHGVVMRNPDFPDVNKDDGRHYISTVAHDFNTCDFVATFTYTNNPGGTGDGSGFYLFFGIGSGEVSGFSREPATALIFVVDSFSRSDSIAWIGYRSLDDFGLRISGTTVGFEGWDTTVPFGTQSRLEIAKTGDSVTFSWDADNSGEFDH